MYRYALAGVVLAALATLFLAGFVLRWVGQFGPYAVFATALGFRIAILVLVVWLALSLLYRGPGRMSCLL
ncbi:MAG TPA: hypothetical protein VMS96_09410 [Terriglobales bacterium]|nr:hypothetical protein [Terriglobales bacterium]